ncbi:DUF188 domain-containing protein [Neobacillus vireti]|uniref:DUF188 domain-containing protein n=1 Tax=Neobacillus vireti TaxID=220686 RepID=UPI003B588FEF
MRSDVELLLYKRHSNYFCRWCFIPVKEENVEFPTTFSLKVLFIASCDHHGNNKTTYANATWKNVDSRKEALDLFIMNHTTKGDITVTQNIGLAF